MLEDVLEFDTVAIRQLVATDPLLAYTVIHHTGESEEQWLQQVFRIEVRNDPVLRSRYRALTSNKEVC